VGHAWTHLPHATHFARSVTGEAPGEGRMAFAGQTSTQAPQLKHRPDTKDS
jgi:hypothetical protein